MDENLLNKLFQIAKTRRHNVEMFFIVDDSYFTIDHFYHIIQVIDPSIEVIFARRTEEAKRRFLENKEKIGLVLMDYRLEDAASGPWLTKNFLIIKPDLPILANSALKSCNELLIEKGCCGITGKKIPQFFQWWNSYFDAPK